MRLSTLYFTAEQAARNALPAKSEELIARHDEVNHVACRLITSIQDGAAERDGAEYKAVMAASAEAREAVETDPLAAAVMDLRRKGNNAAHEEWRLDQLLVRKEGVEA